MLELPHCEAVLTTILSLCFEAKLRKLSVYLCTFQYEFYYLKVGFKGVHNSQACYPDEHVML